MKTETKSPSKLVFSITFAILVAITPMLLSGCGGPQQIGKPEAAAKVIATLVEGIWQDADRKLGLRVQQYPELLPVGTRVQPASGFGGKEARVIVCANPSWLFFIDEQPEAHFAHPVRIVLFDAKTSTTQTIQTDRWPQINSEPIFDTFDKRRDPKTVIFDKAPQRESRGVVPRDIIGGPTLPVKTHDPCDGWAVLVCGYDDLPDTFDEDTEDMRDVLIGLGYLDDHIFFVSPHTAHAGVDRATTIANVQWAINQVAAVADETDKVLFLYSSHGNVDQLSCVPGTAGGGTITAANLDTWLDGITCGELTIVIEACHSGSLIGTYADGTYVLAEDDLTGDGETNRCIFTSASSNTSSYPDVDWAGDPNPGDVGSETVHGYVEAFSVAAADLNGDSEISFGEGWQYAWDNDITRIDGVNTPQMMHTGLIANNVYNYCYRVTGAGDLFVSDGPGDVGNNSYDYNSTDIWVTQDPTETDHQDVVSGMDNLVHVAVHNRGTTAIANVSLSVYWADVSTATSWPTSFTQIGSTHLFSAMASGATETHTWTWYVDPSIGLGHNFCLVAVADSPDDPMTGGPPGTTYIAPYDNNVGQKNVTIVVSHSGHAKFDFTLMNNTRSLEAVDFEMEWVGRPWGDVALMLPDDLFEAVRQQGTKLEDCRVVEVAGWRSPGIGVTGDIRAKLNNIPMRPGDSRVATLVMQTHKTGKGERSELRLRQKVGDTVIGAATIRLQQVDPGDCSWVTKTSVEAFADLALRFKLSSAEEVNKLFAKAVSSGICQKREALVEILSKALSLEEAVVKQIPPETNPEAQRRLASGLEELAKSLKAGSLGKALEAQGRIAEAVKTL